MLPFPLAKTGPFSMLPFIKHLTNSWHIVSLKGHHSWVNAMWICQHKKECEVHQLQCWVSLWVMTMTEMMKAMIMIKEQWQQHLPNLRHVKSWNAHTEIVDPPSNKPMSWMTTSKWSTWRRGFSCTYEGWRMIFGSTHAKSKHEKEKHGGQKCLRCCKDGCKFKTYDKGAMNMHLVCVHGNGDAEQPSCGICGKKFTSKQALDR